LLERRAEGVGDHRGVREVGEVHLGAVGERVVREQDGDERVLAQRRDGQVVERQAAAAQYCEVER
jgi:hypothetical protein